MKKKEPIFQKKEKTAARIETFADIPLSVDLK
jgi:hypothetical protein